MGRKRRSRSRAYGSQRRSRALVLEGTLHIVRPGVATVETQEGTFHVARGGIREGMDGDLVRGNAFSSCKLLSATRAACIRSVGNGSCL